MTDTRPMRRDGVQIAVIDNEMVLYDANLGQAGYLNTSAAAVWQLCDGALTAEEIAETLAAEIGEDPAMLLPDVVAVLAEFRAAGMLAA